MGLIDFAVGYALGAKAGSQGFDEVVSTGKAIFQSREFKDFVSAVRWHLAKTLEQMSRLVAGEQTEPPAENLVDFVRALMERREEAFRRAASAWKEPPST